MASITVPQIVLGVISCYLLTCGMAKGESTAVSEELPHTVSLILLGRRGSGITSTVRQILGPRTTIHPAEVAVASTDILEYTLRIPTSPGRKEYNYLKIVDVPGLELGDNLEHDAEILSTLKSYLHDKGLPTFFLVVYRFDDKHIAEENSQFRQLLKKIEFLQRALFQTTTDNTLFLLTRLLNEPVEVQQSPNGRIDEFRRIIQESTTLPSPVEILVGDNKPDNSTVQIENGFYKLPNNELYPKNVLDKLVEVAGRVINDDDDKQVVRTIVKSMTEARETAQYHTQEHVAHPTDEDIFESDLEAFEFLLRQNNLDLPSNEIQNVLQLSYEKQDASTQISSCLQLLALRVSLRNLKLVENIEQLPQTLTDQARFFQKDVDGVLTSKYSLHYLKHALALEVPEYPSQNLVVGLGYDVVHDRLLRKTPFLRNPLKRPSSSLGYQFPDFVECEKLIAAEEVILANSTGSLEAYHLERLNYLTFSDKDSVVTTQLKGEPKPYLNLNPSENRKLAAVKEVRVLECKMTVENDSISIVDESFTSAVNSLPHLIPADPKTVTEWELFLHSYGTHIVTKTYGGGCYQGSVLLREHDALASQGNIENSLNAILSFTDLESSQSESKGRRQFYQFHVGAGDDIDARANQIHHLTTSEKTTVLEDWKSHLSAQFEMLTNEMELVPISQLIKVINLEKGKDAEAATKLLYQGKLLTGNTDKSTNQAELREKAKEQASKLKTFNSGKILEEIHQLDKFLDAAS